MSKTTEAILDVAVKRSLGYDPIESAKYSIVPCAQNVYLSDEYDPFEALRFEIMLTTLQEKYSLND